MSSEQNRRTFLKLSAMGMAAATSEFASAASLLPPSSDITVRVTGGTSRYSTGTPLAWRSSNKTPANTVVLDPQKNIRRCSDSEQLLPMQPATPSTDWQRPLATNCFTNYSTHPKWD